MCLSFFVVDIFCGRYKEKLEYKISTKFIVFLVYFFIYINNYNYLLKNFKDLVKYE